MPGYELSELPDQLVAPAIVVSFEDWVDAAGAASAAARHIANGGQVVATFEGDLFYDYRSHRPVLDIVDGIPKRFDWPTLTLTHRRLPERDLFVLSGPEPDYRWRGFAAAVLELSLRIGIVQHVSLGAIPAAVPHTAPTPVMMTASPDSEGRASVQVEGLLRVPAAAVSLIEWTMAENGIPAVGFWAQIPHYAAPFAPGSIALIRRVEDHLGVTIGAGALEEEEATQRAALQQLLEGNEDAREYIERLQGMMGEQEVPPAENIAEEVERFLRNQRRGREGPTPFSP
jgi:hypothetical protein